MTTSEKYLELVSEEHSRCLTKYPRPFANEMEALSVILKQFQDAQNKAYAGMPKADILREVVQMGSMCQRMVEDCSLIQ